MRIRTLLLVLSVLVLRNHIRKQGDMSMRNTRCILVCLCICIFFILWSLSTVVGYQSGADIHRLDPGWIRGPIWGRICGYDVVGFYNESLFFYAKNVHYFGIGHAFSAGLYPCHWRNMEVRAYYCYFDGIINDYIIFGKISGLPNQ